MSAVTVVSRWPGWCDPCRRERPLVLTATGERGLRSWLSGSGREDRSLRLTCSVCGQWQDVPRDAADDPVVLQAAGPAAALATGSRQLLVHAATDPVVPLPPTKAVPGRSPEPERKPEPEPAPVLVLHRVPAPRADPLDLLVAGPHRRVLLDLSLTG